MKLQDTKILREETEAVLAPFGSIVLDDLFLLGGIPGHGRVVEIHGSEHSNKSTTGYSTIASFQRYTKEPAVIFDFEKTGSITYLEQMGVDISEDMLRFIPTDNIEDCIQKCAKFIREAGIRLFMFDSIPRMESKVIYDDIESGDAFKNTVGAHARAMSNFYRLMLPYISEVEGCFIMINQTRARIEATREAAQAQKYPSFTNLPYVLPGGKQTRYVPSVMLELNLFKGWRSDKAPDDPFLWDVNGKEDEFLVHEVKARILKNKVTNGGFREHSLYFRPGQGMDDKISVRQIAREIGLINYVGKKWIVGVPETNEPIAVFDNKEQAVKVLTVDEDPKLMGQLRSLVSEELSKQNSKYSFEMDPTERSYVMGEADMAPGDEESGGSGESFKVEDVSPEEMDGLES